MPKTTTSGTLSCPHCGSQYFAEAEFRRYDNRTYGSHPGGGMVSISEPRRLYVCLCGRPFPPDEKHDLGHV